MENKDEKWLQSVSIMHADFLPFNDKGVNTQYVGQN
jgi:hypothetical protein